MNNKVEVLTVSGKIKETFEENNVTIYKEKAYLNQKFIQKLLKLLALKNKDLYHVHGISNFFACYMCIKKPIVLTIHGYASLEAITNCKTKNNSLKFKLIRLIEKKAVKNADVTVAVGSKLKDWIITELGADPKKIFVIPNGVDVNIFKFNPLARHEVFKKHGINNDSPVLLFTKHFSPRYGANDLIMALKEITKEFPSTKLIMTNDDEWKQQIISLVEEQNLSENVIFTGILPNEDLPKYYSACDIFVHPSINDQETFGISLIEAMACSKPVIATEVGGPKEIIEGGDNVGVLIQPRSAKELACSVLHLLNNPSKADELGRNARKYVESKYTWDKVTEEIFAVYEYAINSKNKIVK